MTSDLDVMVALPQGRRILTHVPEAIRELVNVHRGLAAPSPALIEAMQKGVIQSSRVLQEFMEIGNQYDSLFDSFGKVAPGSRGMVNRLLQWPMKLASIRENGVRYAAYLHFRAEFQAGKPLDCRSAMRPPPPGWWTGSPSRSIKRPKWRVTPWGTTEPWARPDAALRRHLLPFWSWQESNLRRYATMVANVGRTYRDVGFDGRHGNGSPGGCAAEHRRRNRGRQAVRADIQLLCGHERLEYARRPGGKKKRWTPKSGPGCILQLGTWDGTAVTLRFPGRVLRRDGLGSGWKTWRPSWPTSSAEACASGELIAAVAQKRRSTAITGGHQSRS